MDSIEVKRAIAIQHILSHMMSVGGARIPLTIQLHQEESVSRTSYLPNAITVQGTNSLVPQEKKRKQYSVSDTAKIWKSVFGSTMEGVCKLCGESRLAFETRTGTDAWEISHIIPHRDGGSDEDLNNLRPLCRSCNRSMGKREFKSFAFERYTERYDDILEAFNLT
jgi:5-methylcytosine-specific restriction endonuclease McrA